MKKGLYLLIIADLLLVTILVLGVAYVRHYKWDKNILAGNTHVEQETELNTDINTEVSTEELDSLETEATESDEVVYEFVRSDISYFEDALFIGDSRGVGIKEYGTLEPMTFFTLEGMSIHNLWKKEIAIRDLGTMTLEALLNAQDFGKVYIMLGYNELGYDQTYSATRYKETLDRIHEMEPNAIIYICSNLHVTEELSSSDELFTNENINNYNDKLKAFADQETFFYIDVNTPFDDATGSLPADYTSDKVHLYAKYYKQWCDWFCENTIRK